MPTDWKTLDLKNPDHRGRKLLDAISFDDLIREVKQSLPDPTPLRVQRFIQQTILEPAFSIADSLLTGYADQICEIATKEKST